MPYVTRLLKDLPGEFTYCGCELPAPFLHATGLRTCLNCEQPILCRICQRSHSTFDCPVLRTNPVHLVRVPTAILTVPLKESSNDPALPAA